MHFWRKTLQLNRIRAGELCVDRLDNGMNSGTGVRTTCQEYKPINIVETLDQGNSQDFSCETLHSMLYSNSYSPHRGR